MTRTYDSVRSKEAVTLRLKYSAILLSNMNERCGDLVSRTCLAGANSFFSVQRLHGFRQVVQHVLIAGANSATSTLQGIQ